jgi:PAS domain S-box-containing protein
MAQKTRYRLFFNSLNNASFVHQPGPDGTPGPFLEANDAACRRYGYTRDELLRMTPADFAVGGAEERVASCLRALEPRAAAATARTPPGGAAA